MASARTRGVLAGLLAAGSLLGGCGGGGHHRTSSTSATTTPTTTASTTTAPTTTASSTAGVLLSGGAPAQPAPSSAVFGVNVNWLYNAALFTPQQIEAQLHALHQTGATVARTDSMWELSESAPPRVGVHHYSWTFDDTIAGSLAANGIRWLPIIDYTAVWDETVPNSDHSAPATPGYYAAYAGALAARYGPGGTFWRTHPDLIPLPVTTYEIWNEPDGGFWLPAPNAAAYDYLYLKARAAIDTVQPDARVIVGGLSAATTFLPQMLAAAPQLRDHVDGVAVHPYAANPLGIVGGVRADRMVLDRLGMSKVPLYVTEFGWATSPSTAPDYASAPSRATYIRQTLTGLGHINCGVAAAILYTWVTPQKDPNNREDWFGIHPPAGGTDPATAAFAEGVHAAATLGRQYALCPPS